VLANLNKFTQYHVIVQAYTSQGSGPPSKEISVQTMEDGECSEWGMWELGRRWSHMAPIDCIC